MKKYIAAVFIFSALTGAAAGKDCVQPEICPLDRPCEGEELRQHMVAMNEFILCLDKNDESETWKIKFPGQAEMRASRVDHLKASLKLWKNRKQVPNLEQLKASRGDGGRAKEFRDYGTHMDIAGALYGEEQLQHQSPYLDEMRAKGIDPRTEAAKIAKSLRISPPKPWFSLGTASIYRASEDIAMKTATENLKEPNETYQQLLGYLRKFEIRVDSIMSKRRNFVTEIANKVRTMEQEIYKNIEAGLKPNDDLVQNLALAQKQNARLLREMSSTEEDLEKTIKGIKSSILEAEKSVSVATLAYIEQMSSYGGVIEAIESKDARLFPISQNGQEALRNEIRMLDAEIASRSKMSLVKDEARSAAREKLKKAASEAGSKGADLAMVGIVSVIIQAQLEIQSSVLNLALAAKGGPGGVLAEATSQLVGNVFISGPNYYDASGIGRDLAVVPREPGTEDQSASWPPEGGSKAIRDQAQKEALATPFRWMGDHAKMNKTWGAHLELKIEADNIRDAANSKNPLYRRRINLPKGMAKRVADQEEIAIAAAKAFGKSSGKAGLKALAKGIGRDVLVSAAKELTKEAVKRAAAELIEGGALQDYMAAQLGVHEAAAEFQIAGDLYWSNEDIIAEARGTRDGYRERLMAGDMVVEKSNAFFPSPGYRFSIVLRSGSIPNPRQFKADVELEGVKLIRDPGTTALAWMIPDGAKFGLDLNEELILKIDIK